MRTWTVAALLFAVSLLAGCGQKSLPPATETPKPDHEAMQKGIEFQKKMGGHRMPGGR